MKKMKNLVLIGMPGCGKSSLGVILAKTLGMGFVDTDLIIQQQQRRKLQEIIQRKGLKKFLQAEEKAVFSLVCQNTVIATGGSVVYSEKAMRYLKKSSKIIYLELPYDTLVNRIQNVNSRGIALEKDQTLEEMYHVRIPLYRKYADLVVNCSGLTVEEEISTLVKIL